MVGVGLATRGADVQQVLATGQPDDYCKAHVQLFHQPVLPLGGTLSRDKDLDSREGETRQILIPLVSPNQSSITGPLPMP